MDACNGFILSQDNSFIIDLLSTIIGDTANLHVVVLLPSESHESLGNQWIVERPPHMNRCDKF